MAFDTKLDTGVNAQHVNVLAFKKRIPKVKIESRFDCSERWTCRIRRSKRIVPGRLQGKSE